MNQTSHFLDNLFFTLNAVMPIVVIIGLGYFLKQHRIIKEDFFPVLNRLCFRCCLPCLLFYNVYNLDNISKISDYTKICLFAAVSILIIFSVALVAVILLVKDEKQKGVLHQCAYRSNYAIIGISLATSICQGDTKPVVAASILSSISIPLFNVLATISLSIFVKDNEKKVSVISVLKKIITNPLILGVAAGFICLSIRFIIPVNADGSKYFTIRQNLPFVGGNFSFSAVKKLKKQIIAGVVSRTVLCPLACLFAAYKAGFSSLEFPALIALYGTPIAVSTVPMTAEMGSDSELAGQLVVWTTLSSAFSLFAIIFFCAQTGIL